MNSGKFYDIRIHLVIALIVITNLSACQFGGDVASDITLRDYPVVYVKQPQSVLANKVTAQKDAVGSDLFLRDISSPDSLEFNLTQVLTLGKGSVAGPEVSYDGASIIFSMKCTPDSSVFCNQDFSWNVWHYDLISGEFTRVINDFDVANSGDDIDPAYLSDTQIVFSSTRQKATRARYSFPNVDNSTGKVASVLHVMNTDGEKIEQISFNHTDDVNPTVLSNGKIMYSRWEKEGGNSRLAIFTTNPDGSDMNVLYGAHSPGEAFLHPRELKNGKIISTVLPLEGTWMGGALMEIDSNRYSDSATPGSAVLNKNVSGQQSATIQNIPLDKSISKLGRFTTPYPVLDGSNQVLVSFSFFQELKEPASIVSRETAIEGEEAPPLYGIYLLDMDDKSVKPLVLAEPGFVMLEPTAVTPKTMPIFIPRRQNGLAGDFSIDTPEGYISVKSVYDTDQFGRMGQGVLTANENAATPIPLKTPDQNVSDFRQYVADIEKIKDPLITTSDQRPARFIRVTTVKPVPPGFDPYVLGVGDLEIQQLIGYAPIEPDGSVKVKVPADIPLILTVLDKYGRAFEPHNSRLQVRPGEVLECNGCHSPQRNISLNSSPVAGQHKNTLLRSSNGQILNALPIDGETMAETRVRVDIFAAVLSPDVSFSDVWTDPGMRPLDLSTNYRYSNLSTPKPLNGIINYSENIQPIWTYQRNGGACVSCHNGLSSINNPTALNLNSSQGTGARDISYEELLIGGLALDENGLPLFESIGSDKVVRRVLPLVNSGYARGSHLIEILFNEELFADKSLVNNGTDHRNFLTSAEKRLVVEWIDTGSKFYNDPYDENNELRKLESFLSFVRFDTVVQSGLIDQCGLCHVLTTVGGGINDGYQESQFLLTRDIQSDFYSVSRLVDNRLNPEQSSLLARPSGVRDNGVHVDSNGAPLLPPESALYKTLIGWIENGGR